MKSEFDYGVGGSVFAKRNRSNLIITDIDFPYLDSRARRIGSRIYRFIETITESPDANSGYLVRRSNFGSWYVFEPHATRDGIVYGASQQGRYFRTEKAREDAVAEYLADAEKRASKAKK